MSEAEREAFLGALRAGGRGIGFAVLGGSFGEGIDLPGERLIGAFVATLGLPQVNPVNEADAAPHRRRPSARATTTPTCSPASRRWCRRPAA